VLFRSLVLNRPPSVSINTGGGDFYFANTWITFDANASRDPDGAITGWAWDFGDGTTDNVSGPIARHLYSRSGLFTVGLNVTDDDGACAAASVDMVVAKDLIVTGFNATLYKNGDGLILANVTVLFSNLGDAKAAGTVRVNVTSYKAGAQPPPKHVSGDIHTGPYEAPIYSQTQGLSITIADVPADGDLPEQTWYWVELAYGGAVIDSGWYQ
jgi:PKD repeat protein